MHKTLTKLCNPSGLKKGNFFLIAGPCVIEDESMALDIAEKIKDITKKLDIPYIFKASYKKANRTNIDSFTGIGDEKALNILKKIKEKLQVPVLTDIHSEQEAKLAAGYVDILQIPAFLCRQTELLVTAAKMCDFVNIKKGQFLSPESMKFIVEKIQKSSNSQVLLTERGTTFGYGDIVVDYRSIPLMQNFNVPVILDATHSLQQPNQNTGVTGGLPNMINTIASAGIAAGADGIFIETHPNPSEAKSDGANMLSLDKMEELLNKLTRIRKSVLK